MRSAKFGIVLRVRDLAKCRVFYRDILELGNPVIDSNFQCVFTVGRESSLSLEAVCPEDPLPAAESRIALLMIFEDSESVIERLESSGYPALNQVDGDSEAGVLEFHDPEGNPFYIQYP